MSDGRGSNAKRGLAALNHPNIAQVYGVEGSEDVRALAMEMVLAINVDGGGQSFDSGATRHLFDVRVPATQLGTRSPYAVSRDGKRFLFNMWDAGTLTPITVVVNWPASLH